MAQITIYLEDDILALVKAVTKSAGTSQSKWIAEAVRLRARKEWPADVLAAAGTWTDFPTAEQIRKTQGADVTRERF